MEKNNSWRLEGTTLYFNHLDYDYFWDMPAGYVLPSDELLSLVEFVLLRPFGIDVEVKPKRNKKVDKVALAFSGGVDSAAAYELLGRPLCIYTKVDRPGGLHKLENALLALKEVHGLSVTSNQDLLATVYGKSRGFYGTAGWTVPSLLLSEHFGLDTFADGNIIEFVYLKSKHGHGTLFNRPDYRKVQEAFKKLNYSYCLPCAGLTEVTTTKIAENFQYAMGCMRGINGKPCLKCMKCYRKKALQGECISSNPEAEKVLNKEWIPVLGSLLWARDTYGLNHPRLNALDKEYGWVDKWFDESLEFVPEAFRDVFLAKLNSVGVQKLSDKTQLFDWNSKVDD